MITSWLLMPVFFLGTSIGAGFGLLIAKRAIRGLVERTTQNEIMSKRLAQAVLLFHRGGPWDERDRRVWTALTGSDVATTRTLCDVARDMIAP